MIPMPRPNSQHGASLMRRTRSWRRFFRFSLRRLLFLVSLFSCLCWFIPRWGKVLVALRVDRVLVPLGIAVYSEHSHEDDLMGMEIEKNKAVWISDQSCGRCHKLGSEFEYKIAFPYKLNSKGVREIGTHQD